MLLVIRMPITMGSCVPFFQILEELKLKWRSGKKTLVNCTWKVQKVLVSISAPISSQGNPGSKIQIQKQAFKFEKQ